MNKIHLIGNLTADPETRTTQTGKTVCTFNIAVNRKKTSEPTTDFFRINAWNKLADPCVKYLAKGRKVAVLGELQVRTYEDRQGKTRVSLDVEADDVEFLTPKEDAPKPKKTRENSDGYDQTAADLDRLAKINSDDLPF